LDCFVSSCEIDFNWILAQRNAGGVNPYARKEKEAGRRIQGREEDYVTVCILITYEIGTLIEYTSMGNKLL